MRPDGKCELCDLVLMKTAVISNKLAAEVLNMDPGRLAQYAKEGQLHWNVIVSGDTVKHSREDFIRYWSGEPKEETEAPKRTAEDLLEEVVELIRVQNTMIMEMLANIKESRQCGNTDGKKG